MIKNLSYTFITLLLTLFACSEKDNKYHANAPINRSKSNVTTLHEDFSNIDSLLSCLYDSVMYHEGDELFLNKFDSTLRKYLSDTVTFQNAFTKLDKQIHILQTPSSSFKIYSYDDFMGGTMRFYKSYIQYQDSSKKVRYKILGDESKCYHAITLIDKNHYVLMSHMRYSNCGLVQNIQVISFENNEIKYHNNYFPAEFRDTTNMIKIDSYYQFDLKYDSLNQYFSFKEIIADTLNRIIKLNIKR